MADSRVPGDLACMKLRPNELCGRRMLFDSMTNQARLIDQTYLPRHKAATNRNQRDIVHELFVRRQTERA